MLGILNEMRMDEYISRLKTLTLINVKPLFNKIEFTKRNPKIKINSLTIDMENIHKYDVQFLLTEDILNTYFLKLTYLSVTLDIMVTEETIKIIKNRGVFKYQINKSVILSASRIPLR